MKGFEKMLRAVGLAAAAGSLPMQEAAAQQAPVHAEQVRTDFTDVETLLDGDLSAQTSYSAVEAEPISVNRPSESGVIERIQGRFNEQDPLTIPASSIPGIPENPTTDNMRFGGMEIAKEDAIGISFTATNRPQQD